MTSFPSSGVSICKLEYEFEILDGESVTYKRIFEGVLQLSRLVGGGIPQDSKAFTGWNRDRRLRKGSVQEHISPEEVF